MAYRILVDPDLLRRSSTSMKGAATEMRERTRRSDGVVNQLIWDARVKAHIYEQAQAISRSGNALSEAADALARMLSAAADRFEAADRPESVGIPYRPSPITGYVPPSAEAYIGAAQDAGNIAGGGRGSGPPDWFSINANLFENDLLGGDGGGPSLGIDAELLSGEVEDYEEVYESAAGAVPISSTHTGSLFGYNAVLGTGVNEYGQPVVGLSAEGHLGQIGAESAIGNENLAFTSGVNATVGGANAQLGFEGRTFGAGAGVNFGSVEASTGANVAGVNTSASIEAGLKFELGISVGAKTEIKLPGISVGLSFGGAK